MLSSSGDINAFPEPMHLGSPGSPPSHGSAQFLPSYLMGEIIPGSLSPGPRLWSSSSQNLSRTSLNKSVSFQGPAASPSFSATPRSESRTRAYAGRTSKDKSGGPPIQGLLEQTSLSNQTLISTPDRQQMDYVTKHRNTPNSSFTDIRSTPTRPGMSLAHQSSTALFTPNQSFSNLKMSPSPAQIDPFYAQGDSITPNECLDETWITVFGFPPAAASFVLQQFSQYGTILHHQIATNGNWMHVHYQTKLQAKKALSKNGKVFGNSIMVGVAPCIDKTVMNKCHRQTSETMANNSTLQSSDYMLSSLESKMNPTLSSIRPLANAYKTATRDHEVVPQSKTPQKNTNIVAKAMEYVFGW